LGICNGFQALIKSGLLPYGQISQLDKNSATLSYNLLGRHISRLSATKIVNNSSPWLSSFAVGSIQHVAMSHGEGRLIVSSEEASHWFNAGQVACQYVDLNGSPTLDGSFNPNGSDYAIEAITSPDGRILGKMGHSERVGDNLYKNISGEKTQDIFKNGVRYFS
jgi:phosphoribosylformylglycinamidine synthase